MTDRWYQPAPGDQLQQLINLGYSEKQGVTMLDAVYPAGADENRTREPWTGDGSEEPPAHVTKVRDKHGCTRSRTPAGWGPYENSDGGYDPGSDWGYPIHSGPYTEVLPE